MSYWPTTETSQIVFDRFHSIRLTWLMHWWHRFASTTSVHHRNHHRKLLIQCIYQFLPSLAPQYFGLPTQYFDKSTPVTSTRTTTAATIAASTTAVYTHHHHNCILATATPTATITPRHHTTLGATMTTSLTNTTQHPQQPHLPQHLRPPLRPATATLLALSP